MNYQDIIWISKRDEKAEIMKNIGWAGTRFCVIFFTLCVLAIFSGTALSGTIISVETTENPGVGDSVILTVNPFSGSTTLPFYRFYYCAQYGTPSYSQSPWVIVQDYSQTNQAKYFFPDQGHYVAVARVVSDPNKEPAALPIVGTVIPVTENADVRFSSLSADKTSMIYSGQPVTFTANASSASGDDVYYRFFYRENYGTDAYESTDWKAAGEYSTENSYTFTFGAPGNIVIVVRAVTDPLNEPSALPIIGCILTISDPLKYKAEGTYNYREDTGQLTLTTKSTDFPGHGLSLGSTSSMISWISETRLTLTPENGSSMLFERPSGETGDLTGTWATASDTEMAFTATFEADGTFSLTGTAIGGGLGYSGFGFHNNVKMPAIYIQIDRPPEFVNKASVNISGPESKIENIALSYFKDRNEWGNTNYVIPFSPEGGIWWLSAIHIEYLNGSNVQYSAGTPYGTYEYDLTEADGQVQQDIISSVSIGQDYVPEYGSDYFYIETFPNLSSQGVRTDPVLKVYRHDDTQHWYAFNDDGGRASLAAGLRVPMTSGLRYYIQAQDLYNNGGSYAIKISRSYFDGSSNQTVESVDAYEPDDSPETATRLMLDQVQDHSFTKGDSDWFYFIVP